MGLLASLYAALFGPRPSNAEPQRPGELTAVAPDFTGFVSNRPHEPKPAAIDPAVPRQASVPQVADQARAVQGGRPFAGNSEADEFTAVAPGFSGRVSNRPQPGSPDIAGREAPSNPPHPGKQTGQGPDTISTGRSA